MCLKQSLLGILGSNGRMIVCVYGIVRGTNNVYNVYGFGGYNILPLYYYYTIII